MSKDAAAPPADADPPWHRILIVAPVGQSAAVMASLLRDHGFEPVTLADVEALVAALDEDDAGAVILLQEAVAEPAALARLARALGEQPPWSDIAVHILTRTPRRSGWTLARLAETGYDRAILLPRPIAQATLISVVRAAVRARSRQYLLRDVIDGLERSRLPSSLFGSARQDHHAADVLHDLRTPLATVGFALDVVAQQVGDGTDPTVDEALSRARTGIRELGDHSAELIDFVKQGSQVEHEAPRARVDMEAVLAEVRRVLDAEAHVTWSPLPAVLGDELLLRRLFQNLVGNGLKYNDSSVPRIEVSATLHGGWVRVAVRDNGIGISEEDKTRIFQPFLRGSNQDHQGMGVGLASCQHIVQRWGGKIWVEDGLDGGSVFSFTVPSV